MMDGAVIVGSSWGVEQETMGASLFDAHAFIGSDRVKMLARRGSYYRATQHDWKTYDWDGRMILPGTSATQPLLGSEQLGHFVPLRLRRPPTPYRLARVIVNQFNSLVFGRGRWPTIRVHGDPRTEKFVRALEKAAKLRRVMVRARAIGGSSGSVGLSWRWLDGKPAVQAHNPKHVYVHSWADLESLVPEHVTEIYTYSRECWDPVERKMHTRWFWYRRDWTPISDVAFKECEYIPGEQPKWEVDEAKSIRHEDGFAHFVWVQNVPEEDCSSIDGQPDYAELYESLDSLDLLKSVVVKGATLNLDPTLVLHVDPDIVQRVGVKKGSDNAIVVGLEPGSGAEYLELSGTSIEAGSRLLKLLRDAILESAQCVAPDPNQIGAAGTSSIALKVIYEPALAKADIFRETYGEAISRLLDQMTRSARRLGVGVPVDQDVVGEDGQPMLDDEGKPVVEQVVPYVALPPEVVTSESVDEETGEKTTQTQLIDLVPGDGGEIELVWGEYFNPTADDKNKAMQTIQVAVVSRVMSQESGAEEVAAIFGRSPRDEVARIEKQSKVEDARRMAEMLPGAGIEVPDTQKMPGAKEFLEGETDEDKGDAQTAMAPGTPGTPATKSSAQLETNAGAVKIGVDAFKIIITVNEARASSGFGPLLALDGSPDPDGRLTIAEFEAKKAASGKSAGEVVGEAAGQAQVQEVSPAAAPSV